MLRAPVQLQTIPDWQHIEEAGSRNFQHTPDWPACCWSVSFLIKKILPLDFPGFLRGTTRAPHRPSSAVGGSSCPPCSGWFGSCRLVLGSLRWRAWTRPRCPVCARRRPRWSWGKSHLCDERVWRDFKSFSPVSFLSKPFENPSEVITSVQGLLLTSKDSCQCLLR